MSDCSSVRILTAFQPSAEDVARAKALPRDACPRRYCWWWHSLSFDWTTPVKDGCTFLTADKPPDYPNEDCPCRRAEPASLIDHYEPREPHLIEDGVVPAWYWPLE